MSTNADEAISAFFQDLVERGPVPSLAKTSGTVRFDLTDDGREERWYVTFTKGSVAVSHKRGVADASLRLDKGLFAQFVSGVENPMAAVLRGACEPEGDLNLLLIFQRIFPGPPSSTGSVPPLAAPKG
jgi:hypothetical protein